MAPTAESPESLPTLHRALLLTVLYGDLFDHPLTVNELHRFLMAPCPRREDLDRALETLTERWLAGAEGFVCWRGREATIEVRRRRQRLAAERWPPAERFAGWLGRVPFLRMVAVCGSQAMENGDDDGDVDLFLITAPRRLWLVQSLTMALRRAGRRLGVDFCPNYLLTEDSLEIGARDLYNAREAAQSLPLWGGEVHERFLEANRWTLDFLPQHRQGDLHGRLRERPRHRLTAALERLLGGRLGDALDGAVHRLLLLYYRWRLRRHGWSRRQIEGAYRRDRQGVITGGYAAAVAKRFVEHGVRELGGEISRDELKRWFFGGTDPATVTPAAEAEADPLYAGLMATRYGGGR